MYGNSRHTINTGDRRSYYLLCRLLRPIPASVSRPVLQRNKINIIIFISIKLSVQFIIHTICIIPDFLAIAGGADDDFPLFPYIHDYQMNHY